MQSCTSAVWRSLRLSDSQYVAVEPDADPSACTGRRIVDRLGEAMTPERQPPGSVSRIVRVRAAEDAS
jgi:hypothetical protein